MTIGLITITHDGIGEALTTAAASILGEPALRIRHFAFGPTDCVQSVQRAVAGAVADLDSGDGVLILTDLYGSSPCNIAERLAAGGRIGVISGINLAMVLRVFTYARLELEPLVQRACEGARRGIIDCTPTHAEKTARG